jgi:hypothetical protein
MKLFTTLLFLLLLCTGVRAQTTILQVDSSYFLEEITTSDNGTDRPDTLRTVRFIGDTTDYIQTLRDIRRTYAATNARLFRKIYEANFSVADRDFLAAASAIGVDLDSIETAVLAPRILSERMVLSLQVTDIPAGLIPDFTSDTEPSGRVKTAITYGFNENGILRLIATEAAGRWRISIVSPLQIDVRNLYGAGTGNTVFFLTDENDRRKVFREIKGIVDGGGALIIVRK